MRRLKRARPALAATSNGAGDIQSKSADKNTSQRAELNKPFWTKRRRVLAYFARGGALNRFEAVSRLHDWVLPSTVAQIQSSDGVEVARKSETVRGYLGSAVTVARYWLTAEQRQRAQERLAKDMVGAGHATTIEDAIARLEDLEAA